MLMTQNVIIHHGYQRWEGRGRDEQTRKLMNFMLNIMDDTTF